MMLPFMMECTFPIYTAEGMRAEIVTLCLDEISP